MDSRPRLSQRLVALAALASFLVLLVLPLPGPARVYAQEDNDAPTASISAGPPFTAAESFQVDITFNKPCYQPGAGNQTGFQCSDAAACDLLVYGDGAVLPSSLNETEPGLKYSLQVNLSTINLTGKVSLAMQKAFCVDSAGRRFQRTANSTATVRFDRTPVTVNVWTPIVGAQLQINDEARTVEATNSTADLLLYLDFSSPVLNTSLEIGSALVPAHATLSPTGRKSKGNRRFAFKIQTNHSTSVVSVALPPNTVYGRSGLAVEPTSVACLYDPVRPSVKLVTQSPSRTRDQQVTIFVQFSEPVFGFNRSGVGITGGTMTSFEEQSKLSYALQIYVAADRVVSVVVGENKAVDVAGNANLASNTVQVRHYTTPAVSVALSSFVTVGLLATAVASGTLAISSATLAAAGALASRTAGSIGADPSRNLLGMASHVQVLALSSYLAVSLPIKYSETARGLRWTIPNVRLPWEGRHSEVITPVGGTPSVSQFMKVPRMLMAVGRIDIDGAWLGNRGKRRLAVDAMPLKLGVEGHRSRQERRLGANGSMYGPALSATEYETFFLNGSFAGVSPVVVLSSVSGYTTHGWWGFGRNLFWLGTVGGALVVLHMVLVVLLRWRTRTSLRGSLSFPRFELFLLILAMPCVCQASAFVIRGGSAGGIVVGVLLLAVPVSLFLSVGLFLVVAVFMGAFVQYEEVKSDEREKAVPLLGKILRSIAGKNVISKWVRREGLAPTFLPRYGLLFEDRKGPPKIKTLESGAAPPRWVYSGVNGIGRMRAVDTSDESEVASITDGEQLLGSLRSAYLLVDMARRIGLGVVSGAYYTGQGQQSWSQVWVLWSATLLQLVYLVVCKPFVRRGVQLVETISVLCELGIFTASLVLLARHRPADDDSGLSVFMMALLLLSFVAQLVNEWYALMNQLLKLAPTEDTSLKLGLKMLAKGLLLPLLPRSRWCSYISPQILQPKSIGVGTAIPPQSSPEPLPSSSPGPAMDESPAAPVRRTSPSRYAPGSPVFIDPRAVVSIDVDDAEAGEIRAAEATPPPENRSRKAKSRRRLKSKSASEESSIALEQLMDALDMEASPKLAGFRTPPEPTGSAPALF